MAKPKKKKATVKEVVTEAVKAELALKDNSPKPLAVVPEKKKEVPAEVKKDAAPAKAKKGPGRPRKSEAEKAAAKKAPAKKTAKAPAKKAAAKKAAPKKTTEKKSVGRPRKVAAGPVVETYFESSGMQVKVDDIRANIEAAYRDAGHRVGNIKSLQIYYNFDERRAYYVVNEKAEGLYVEF